MNPAIKAPAIGATKNSHSWLRLVSPANNAGPVDRAGFTDVSDRDADEVDERQRARPIAMAAKPLGARGVGDAENDVEEHGRQQDLDQRRGEQGVPAG